MTEDRGSSTASEIRLDWIDILRGIGIFLVIAGHAFDPSVVMKTVSLFRMPLFFCLSGFMFRPTKDLKTFVSRRVLSLLVPYFAFLILVTMVDFGLGHFDGNRSIWLRPVGPAALQLIAGGSALKGVYSVFWFVPCLFFTNVLYACIERLGGNAFSPSTLAAIGFFYALSYLLPTMDSPLGLAQVPQALLFFWLGTTIKELTLPKWTVLTGLVVVLAGVIWAPPLNMKYMAFGWPVLSAVVAFSGVLLLIGVAKTLQSTGVFATILRSLGQFSIVFMFLHQIVLIHLKPIVPDIFLFALAIFLPWGVALIFDQIRFTQYLFMGKMKLPQPSAKAT